MAAPAQHAETLSPTSVNTYVRAVKGFWSWLKREGIITGNSLAGVPAPKLPRKLPVIYSEDQLETILVSVRQNLRNRAIIELLLDSGIRLSELTGLSVNDVDTRDLTVKVFGKGGKERYSYISPITALTIRAYLDNARPGGRRQAVSDS